MIYGYIRVSTDKQTTENQRFEIRQFAEKNGIIINRWFEETISGATDFRQRKLGKLLKKLTKNDILIASEISRLGRNMLQVMTILHYCLSAEAQVWTIRQLPAGQRHSVQGAGLCLRPFGGNRAQPDFAANKRSADQDQIRRQKTRPPCRTPQQKAETYRA